MKATKSVPAIHPEEVGGWLPSRYRDVARRQCAAFNNVSGYVPLGLSLRNFFSINQYPYYENIDKLFAAEMAKAEPQREIGSDVVPCLVVRHDPVVLPRMFGGKVVEIGGRPMVEPFLGNLDVIRNLDVPKTLSGIVPRVSETLEVFRQRASDDLVVCKPPQLDPFDAALLMYGSDLLFEMIDHPDDIHGFLSVLTEAFVGTEKHFRRILDEPDHESLNYLGVVIPGVRVAADALVNLSAEMIREFCFPIFDRLAEVFGGVLVHYCPSPNHEYYHVLETVIECGSVIGIDTSGGIDYFDNSQNRARLDGRLTLVADCGIPPDEGEGAAVDAHPNINRFRDRPWSGLGDWLQGEFMRAHRESGRGVILRATVDSVTEGRALYSHWRSLF